MPGSFLNQDHLLEKLGAALNYSSQRQVLIADNIANIQTPLYKRKDIKFSNVLNEKTDFQLTGNSRTHQGHINLESPQSKSQQFQTTYPHTTAKNEIGNNVDIDMEMQNMSINSVFFDTVTTVLNKKLALYKSAIKGR